MAEIFRREPSSTSTARKTGDLALGRRVAERRDELGMSRKELAEATGLSYPHIAQIETGYRLPSTKQQPVLSKVLGMSLDELFNTDLELPAPPSRLSAAPPPAAASAPRRTAAQSAAPSRVTLDGAVARAAEEIEALPAPRRLEALAQLQLRIMEGVTEYQARQRP